MRVTRLEGKNFGVRRGGLGITYLDLFFAERNAIHNIGASDFVWFRISLVFRLENCVVLRAIPIYQGLLITTRFECLPKLTYLVRRRF